MRKYFQVILESGFIGYVPVNPFFIIGSEVKAFQSIPDGPASFARIKSETGKVKQIIA